MPNKATKGKTGATVHLYELHGWMIPNGMNWKDFCEMRIMQGFVKPKKRKSQYLSDNEDTQGYYSIHTQLRGKSSQYHWKNTGF